MRSSGAGMRAGNQHPEAAAAIVPAPTAAVRIPVLRP